MPQKILEALDVVFNSIQRKYELINKKIPFILLVTRVFKKKTSHTQLIFIRLNGDCWIYLSRNTIKYNSA